MLQQSRNLPAPIRISCIRYNILTLCFLKACHHPFPTVPNSLHPWLCSIADIVPSCCSPFPYLCSQSAHLQLLHLQLFPELFLCGSRQEEAQQPRTITGFSSPGVNRSSWPNSPSTIFFTYWASGATWSAFSSFLLFLSCITSKLGWCLLSALPLSSITQPVFLYSVESYARGLFFTSCLWNGVK